MVPATDNFPGVRPRPAREQPRCTTRYIVWRARRNPVETAVPTLEVRIKTETADRFMLLRGDLDALPVHESTGLELAARSMP
jgi:metal-dependent amidase/aminoacylase/carboxypeptidase family protein